MGAAAASTSKSICGWTWHSALNIIPPWSTLFLHVDLVTAVTDWEGRVYPTALGIALLTHDFQPHTAGASRNVCKQFITKKKEELGTVVYDPGIDLLLFSCANGWLVIQIFLFWELSAGSEGWCEGMRFTCVMQRGSFGKGLWTGVCFGVQGQFSGAPRAGCKLETHNVY